MWFLLNIKLHCVQNHLAEVGMEKITSRSNNLIKDIAKLFASRKARYENQKFALEGARLCFDAVNSGYEPEVLLFTEELQGRYPAEIERAIAASKRAVVISGEVAARLSDTQSPQGVFAVCSMKPFAEKAEEGGKYIALDNLQDPSNLGAILRTAEALGVNGAILYNCCDAYNPKALRAAMGSSLRMPMIISENLVKDINELKAGGYSVYATVPDSRARDITTVSFEPSCVCVIGNEGNGISDEVKAACSELITINMRGRAESLNASMAGAITMWEMLR